MADTEEVVVPGVEEAQPSAEEAPVETAAATEEDYVNNNKRKFEDDGEDEGEEAHIRKRGSAPTLEGDGDSAKPEEFSDPPGDDVTEVVDPVIEPTPATNGSATQLVTQTGDGQLVDYVEIPSAMVGKLIGKSGETIKALQYSTHTKVQIDHQAGGDLKKVSIMSNSKDALAAARAQIDKIVNSDEPVAGIGEVSKSVECPPGIVGRIIGRGGETIRALQQASMAHIVVDQNFPEGQPRIVNIKGRTDAVERATKMVQELIQGEPGSAQAIIQKYGAGITSSLDCPKQMVGRVIGKGGETIKGLQKQFGVNIQIDQQSEPNKITVAGAQAAVSAAVATVQEIINGGNPLAAQPSPAAAGARGPQGFGAPFAQPAYGGPATPPAFNPYGPGYGAAAPSAGYPGYPPAAYGGYPGYPPQQAAYQQPPPAAPAAAGGYPGYGAQAAADPYAASQAAYGAQYGAPASPWQELQDGEGRTYYYNTTTGVSQWEKPPELP
eukprot:jgi/Botrbrau1/9447/Bobra.0252s0069.2